MRVPPCIFICMGYAIHEVLERTIEVTDKKIKFSNENQDNSENPEVNDVLKTGFTSLNFRGGELCVLSSKQGMGKTAFVMSLIKQLAVDQKQPVGFVNPGSFSDEYFGQRLLALSTGVNTIKILTGILNVSEVTKIQAAAKELYAAPIEYFNEPNCSFAAAEEAIKNMVQKNHARLIIVEGFDFLQELVDADRDDFRDMLEHLLWNFRCLASELSVPIILVMDLPQIDSDIFSSPTLLDFKKYMIIPTFADKVIFVHRDRLCNKKTPVNVAQLIIAKNESGPTAELSMRFDGITCEFFEEKE